MLIKLTTYLLYIGTYGNLEHWLEFLIIGFCFKYLYGQQSISLIFPVSYFFYKMAKFDEIKRTLARLQRNKKNPTLSQLFLESKKTFPNVSLFTVIKFLQKASKNGQIEIVGSKYHLKSRKRAKRCTKRKSRSQNKKKISPKKKVEAARDSTQTKDEEMPEVQNLNQLLEEDDLIDMEDLLDQKKTKKWGEPPILNLPEPFKE